MHEGLVRAPEPRWRTYLNAAAFSLPALVLWSFCAVFLFPKLQQIWRDAQFNSTAMIRLMEVSGFFRRNGIMMLIAVVAVLLLLELRNDHWPRYRRFSVACLAFLLNTAVLMTLTAMLMGALLAAPALRMN